MFSLFLTCVAALTISTWAWRTAKILRIYCFQPSALPKYRHAADGSWALVTGASDGIGIELARELLKQGFNVFLHGRNESKLAGIKKDLLATNPDRAIELIVADASKMDIDFEAIAKRVSNVPGKLTVLVNNVGGLPMEPRFVAVDEQRGEDIDTIIAINARFPTCLTGAVLPLLKQNQPSLVVNCGSYGGVTSAPYIATYVATKAYVHVFTESLRAEVESEGAGNVEVIGSLIGNTASAGNRTWMAGTTITAAECAQGILARVGCGEVIVAPHWRHWALGALLPLVPEPLARKGMMESMKGRRKVEREEMEEQRKGE